MIAAFITYIQTQMQRDNAFLLPLRLFIGLGWCRAGFEKLIEPEWLNGNALTVFLTDQLLADQVYFPLYEQLIRDIFLPNVVLLSLIIIVGQVCAGIAIGTGTFTNAALLGGLFMNFNFILAGRVSPSAFYVVIQVVLFVGNAGAVMGMDTWLSRYVPFTFLTASARPRNNRIQRWVFLNAAFMSWGFMLMCVPYIRDFSTHSVDDPAMLLTILAGLGGLTALIVALRQMPESTQAPPTYTDPYRV